MIAYVDTSVLLRIVLGQPNRLEAWSEIETAVTSALTEVECLRTLDRRRAQGLLAAEELPGRRGLALRFLSRMNRIDISRAVLERAANPFPTPLGTLDAIHLSSALLFARSAKQPLVMATHDRALADAAMALGLETAGCD